jgi:hypothetical protein
MHESRSRHARRGWLAYLVWALVLVTTVPLLYTGGAIAARVCYLKGILPDGSARLAFAETLFAPINYPYSHSRFFRSGYDSCVAVFVPRQKAEK